MTIIRAVMVLIIGAAVLYALLVVAAYLGQRMLIYPAPSGSQPVPDGYDRVALETADGLEIEAAWREGLPDKPVIVFFHGNGDRWSGAAEAVLPLVRAGFGVLLPEYRGYSGNPGEPTEQGLYRDADAAMDWLLAEGIEAERIVPIGNSLGSGVAVHLATTHGLNRLALVSPFTSLTDAASASFRFLPVRLLLKDRYDNRARLSGYRGKALIVHGMRDTVISAGHARELAALSDDFSLRTFDDAGHELAYLPDSGRAIRQWLEADSAALGQPAPDARRDPAKRHVQPADRQP